MAGKTYPIGSIIKIEDKMALVIGVRMIEEDNKLAKSYLIVPYPTGFTGWEHVRVVAASECEPVSEGYRSAAAEPFLAYMDNMDIASEVADARTINRCGEEVLQKITGGDR